MPLTVEILLAKKAALEKQRDDMLNNLNAISGAIQFCEQLINELLPVAEIETKPESK